MQEDVRGVQEGVRGVQEGVRGVQEGVRGADAVQCAISEYKTWRFVCVHIRGDDQAK